MNVPVPVKGSRMLTFSEVSPAPNSFAAHSVGGPDDEVHDFHGGVDNAEAFHDVVHGCLGRTRRRPR